MKRQQGFKFALMPNGAQERQMRRIAGACRYVYNQALEWQNQRRAEKLPRPGYAALCRKLTQWRHARDTAWLAEGPVHTQQQALKNLEAGWTRYFESLKKLKQGLITPAEVVEPPTFKKKGKHESFRFPDPQQFKLDQVNHRVFLPKLGWIRYRHSRDVLGEVRNITVSESGDTWFVSFQTEREVAPPVPEHGSAVGIDLGLARFATLSDGTVIAPVASFKRHEYALAKAQRCVSRKQKFSRNWHKAQRRVRRIQARIGSVRRNFLHQHSNTISKNHALVCIEDLKVRNMSKSAAGSKDSPGKNVRAKSGLNKAILDQGWYEFRRQLDYKLAWRGGHLIAVPPQNTSRTCPCCAHVSGENRRTQERFLCVHCGYEANADLVAAGNILRAGHARLACEVSDAPRSPAAGTHRSDLGEAVCLAQAQ